VKPKPVLRRATKLVQDGARTVLWLVDATAPKAIQCKKWTFALPALAEAAGRLLAEGIATGLDTDRMVLSLGMLVDGQAQVCDSMLIAVEFFSGGNHVALRRETHAFLADLPPSPAD
jgi:hypothetical protein